MFVNIIGKADNQWKFHQVNLFCLQNMINFLWSINRILILKQNNYKTENILLVYAFKDDLIFIFIKFNIYVFKFNNYVYQV
jgi:hypothetical protein